MLLQLGLAHAQVPSGPSATQEQLQAAFSAGAVVIGVLDASIFVDRYGPDGWVRGVQRGRRSARRWRIEDDRMCTDPTGPGRICFAVQVPAGGGLVDHAALWLRLDNGFGTTAQAVFRAPSMARPSAAGELRGEVIELWRDGMVVRPQGGGADIWVRSRPVRGLSPADRVVLRGRSDGLVFDATSGIRDPASGR